jgi:hypothetical protein
MLLLAEVAPPLHAASASSRSFQGDLIISKSCTQTSETTSSGYSVRGTDSTMVETLVHRCPVLPHPHCIRSAAAPLSATMPSSLIIPYMLSTSGKSPLFTEVRGRIQPVEKLLHAPLGALIEDSAP